MEQNKGEVKEIDLLVFFRTMWNAVCLAVQTVFIFCVKKLGWFAVAIAVGIGVSALFYEGSDQASYYSVITMRSNAMPSGAAINYLNEAVRGISNPKDLAKVLNLPDKVVAQVRKISAHMGVDYNRDKVVDEIDFADYYRKKDTVINGALVKDRFFVRVEHRNRGAASDIDTSVIYLQEIVAAIKSLFEHDDFIQRANALRVAQKQMQFNEVNKQIHRIDSLQWLEFFSKDRIPAAANVQLSLSTEQKQGKKERQLYHDDLTKLINQSIELEKELELYSESVTFINGDVSGFSAQPKVNFVAFSITICLWALLIAFVAAVVWTNRRWIAVKAGWQKP
jgi:hypothetical protein